MDCSRAGERRRAGGDVGERRRAGGDVGNGGARVCVERDFISMESD